MDGEFYYDYIATASHCGKSEIVVNRGKFYKIAIQTSDRMTKQIHDKHIVNQGFVYILIKLSKSYAS